nr:MAG TPA: hypothetical protein [Caudoviricetes sp.]
MWYRHISSKSRFIYISNLPRLKGMMATGMLLKFG